MSKQTKQAAKPTRRKPVNAPAIGRLLDKDGEFQREQYRLLHTQKCGGGRRVIYKHIGRE